LGALLSRRALSAVFNRDDNLQLHLSKKLAFQNLPTEGKIPKAKSFLYQSVFIPSVILSKSYTFKGCSWAQTGARDLVFTKHIVRFIPKHRQTHWIFTTEHTLTQCLVENFCWNPFYLCITNLCQDFILHFANPLIPQTQTILSLKDDTPLIFPFDLCSKKPDWGLSTGCYATRMRQLRTYVHMFLMYPFLPRGTLHLGSRTRICCYSSLWRQTFPTGSR